MNNKLFMVAFIVLFFHFFQCHAMHNESMETDSDLMDYIDEDDEEVMELTQYGDAFFGMKKLSLDTSNGFHQSTHVLREVNAAPKAAVRPQAQYPKGYMLNQ